MGLERGERMLLICILSRAKGKEKKREPGGRGGVVEEPTTTEKRRPKVG